MVETGPDVTMQTETYNWNAYSFYFFETWHKEFSQTAVSWCILEQLLTAAYCVRFHVGVIVYSSAEVNNTTIIYTHLGIDSLNVPAEDLGDFGC